MFKKPVKQISSSDIINSVNNLNKINKKENTTINAKTDKVITNISPVKCNNNTSNNIKVVKDIDDNIKGKNIVWLQ